MSQATNHKLVNLKCSYLGGKTLFGEECGRLTRAVLTVSIPLQKLQKNLHEWIINQEVLKKNVFANISLQVI